MDATELKGHVRQMQKLTEESELLALLETLKNGVVVKESLLRETRAGLAVGKLRSHPIKNVSDAAKELVKQWKQDVENAKTPKPPSPPPPPPPAKPSQRSAQRDLTSIKVTDDPIRDKCIELMYDGLAPDSDMATEDILALATIIEAAVFETHEGTSTEYKARFRTLFVALRHKDTSRWRDAVLNGAIEAERFAALSLTDLMQIS